MALKWGRVGYLVPDQAIAVGALLTARGGAVVEVVLLAHVTASPYETRATLTAAVLLALGRLGALWVTVAGCERGQKVKC